ncbi:HNH endonuclease [Novosphingobium sp. JCM 18896]|uniref:HNH endonuclease n=1 Tax=Novosphingobium sp. JCM 18896 TaxID=2989731 RepID=UPI00222320F3|nr:HNH endonuclease signature motif containing protein [Novosphingobium sp. JCM 18896]MCW1431386.1 HNH endonuclease [Novosphingobium sp. JCM 18896]
MRRDGRLCQPCLRKRIVTPATEVDHVIPKAKGGKDELSNCQAICGPCHQAKTLADEGKRVKPTIGEDGWPIA